jgi:predicted dehydrogenase
MTIGIAILGVGRWGVHFVRHFCQDPGVRVVAIVDPSPEKLNLCRERFNLDPSKTILTNNWENIRLNPEISAVVVATPAISHYPLIKDALCLGYHVLAEKPLTLNPRESAELTALAQEKQRILLVDHTYLFHPAVRTGQQVLQSGSIGKPLYGYATRTHLGPVRQDVSALWDLAIHDISILNTWLNDTPVLVQARGTVWLQSNLADLVWLTLLYADGFQATIHLCWLNPDKQRRLAIVGSEGTLIFNELDSQSPLTRQKGYFERQDAYFIPTGQETESIPIPAAEPLKAVCEHFLESIATGVDSPVSSGSVGTELVKILHAVELSLTRGGEIVRVE